MSAITFRRTLDAERVAAYAELTQDFNPIHLDADFAAGTPFGRRIVHGTLTLTLLWQALAELDPALEVAGARLSVRFTAPVGVGETVTATAAETESGGIAFTVETAEGRPALQASLTRPG